MKYCWPFPVTLVVVVTSTLPSGFTTVFFFTTAGLNMPKIYKDICLYEKFPSLEKRINPLPDGLMWMRGMDTPPRLVTDDMMRQELILNY